MDDVRFRCFLSNSKRSLLEVIKANSSPEKKAVKSSVNRMNMKLSKIRFSLGYNKLSFAKIQFSTNLELTNIEFTNKKIRCN